MLSVIIELRCTFMLSAAGKTPVLPVVVSPYDASFGFELTE